MHPAIKPCLLYLLLLQLGLLMLLLGHCRCLRCPFLPLLLLMCSCYACAGALIKLLLPQQPCQFVLTTASK